MRYVTLTSYFDYQKLDNIYSLKYVSYVSDWLSGNDRNDNFNKKFNNYLDFFFFNFSLSYYVIFYLIVADLEKRS